MTLDPVAQLRLARRHPIACLLGAVPAVVPIGTFYLGHVELTSWDPGIDPKAAVTYAGLAFSVLTTVRWSADTFRVDNRLENAIKALGFTVLVEALMMSAANLWIAIPCLAILVAINALYHGARIAERAAAAEPVRDLPRITQPRPVARYTVVS
jgi:hypothetical protein